MWFRFYKHITYYNPLKNTVHRETKLINITLLFYKINTINNLSKDIYKQNHYQPQPTLKQLQKKKILSSQNSFLLFIIPFNQGRSQELFLRETVLQFTYFFYQIPSCTTFGGDSYLGFTGMDSKFTSFDKKQNFIRLMNDISNGFKVFQIRRYTSFYQIQFQAVEIWIIFS
eukprot:TRINITY_DN10093_c0_g1_i3.p1 TRINITY_DN10093_c0_g1~~TRINITY_DN10093_c0_g1_i3.p1  ORF type:complete len:196 (-),score=-15.40 TRINITY_DN10093_c0_g1_i3:237-749(-)